MTVGQTDRRTELLIAINQSINQYAFSAPSTQVRADEALQMLYQSRVIIAVKCDKNLRGISWVDRQITLTVN